MARSNEDGWTAPLSKEAYIEHLEALIQLQIETIALRDGHYASLRETTDEAVRYARSLEQERDRLDGELRSGDSGRRVRAFLRRR